MRVFAPRATDILTGKPHAVVSRGIQAPVAPFSAMDTDVALFQRKPNCACGGGCPRCQNHLPIQTKLAVSEPGDIYEQEADRVAEQIIATPAQHVLQQSGAAGIRVGQRNEQHDLHPVTMAANSVSTGAESRIGETRGNGHPMPTHTRSFMESSFGADFSEVRIHTDGDAAQLNRQLHSHAFTMGEDIYFDSGKFNPGSGEGKQLLAHELTHVLQQTGTLQRDFNSDDNHNLQSERFSGDDRLENIFDGIQDQYLRFGSSGDAVVKVQQTLIELGFPLPQFGADGQFGSETGNAVSNYKLDRAISPSDPVVGPKTIGALDSELANGGGVTPVPVPEPVPVPGDVPTPTCADGPVNMEKEPLPPVPMPIITRMNAQELYALVKKRQKPGSYVPDNPPLGATMPSLGDLKPVTVRTEPIASENCLKCIADWEPIQPKVEIFTAMGDFSDEPKRGFGVGEQSVSGCPPEGGGTFKDVIKRILAEAEPTILDAELEHWSDFVMTHLLITGRYLSNVRRLTSTRSHLRGNSYDECLLKVTLFLIDKTTHVPVPPDYYGVLCGKGVETVYSDSTSKRDKSDHSAKSVPPKDKKPISPNIDHNINPFTCDAFFRKFDKTVGLNIPGPPFNAIMVDKEEHIPPEQPWNTL